MHAAAAAFAACALAGCVRGDLTRPAGHPPAGAPSHHTVEAWLTTADMRQLLARGADREFDQQDPLANIVEVDAHKSYQGMVGFGAAITDASSIVMHGYLDRRARTSLLRELFAPPPAGIGLGVVRISIGASDFSPYFYSLDDRPPGEVDASLDHFALPPNYAALFSLLREIRAINPGLRVIASPWSAPAWMKDSDSLVGGSLRREFYGAYASYLLRFVDASERAGVPIYALTLQNEPGFVPHNYPGMLFGAAARSRFVAEYLGPLLERRSHAPLLLDWDHNWDHPEDPETVLADPAAARYISGVAWHCYYGKPEAQNLVREAHPDKDVYLTECSGGGWEPRWSVGLKGIIDTQLIGSTRAWSRTVVLWNLALDENHGPHAGGCKNCRGVVTIDSGSGEVTRNVEYYGLAHLSRFVRPGAHRIESGTGIDGLQSVAFRNPDGSLVLLVFNRAAEARAFSVRSDGRSFSYQLSAGSAVTFSWRP